MNWLKKLYDTYESVKNTELDDGLNPYFHFEESCHIEITIDDNGDFISAENLILKQHYKNKVNYFKTKTIIPITPKSLTGRTSGAAPYPLVDKIQYIAKDYESYGGLKTPYYNEYIEALKQWVENVEFTHWKIEAIYKYIKKGNVTRDLIKESLLFVRFDNINKLVNSWSKQVEKNKPKPPLFHTITPSIYEGKSIHDQGNTMVRWKVQRVGESDDTTWKDKKLIKLWEEFANSTNKVNGVCQILGKKSFLAKTHPKGIYSQAYNAKLISSNDINGYTYRGRFTDNKASIEKNNLQAVGISFEVSQKAHSTLTWLIKRQGILIGKSSSKKRPSVVLAWAVSGNIIPKSMESSFNLLNLDHDINIKENYSESQVDHSIDLGQSFSMLLNKFMKGFNNKVKSTDNIVIMILDSPSDGRMAIKYYQELNPKDYINRVASWHEDFAWHQRFSLKEEGKPNILRLISAPSIKSIMTAVYGENISDSLKKNIVSRLLPCIIESHLIPVDIVNKAIQNVCNRVAYKLSKQWLWEINLGIACSLYKGFCIRKSNNTKEYKMALEENNNSPDYLFGRLLAIAERIEYIALKLNNEEKRNTTAARLMHKFAERPSSTWLIIEKALQPYIQRLRSKRAPFLNKMQNLLDDVMNKFEKTDDFNRDKRLSGEFLLAYHCQRLELKKKEDKKRNINNGEEE